MTKIYTKTGDDGTTSLLGGKRVSKSNPRILAYGFVDEVNSSIGIVLASEVDDDIRTLLTKIQNDLFVAGADLANPELTDSSNRVVPEMIQYLEDKVDELEKELTPITNFILPGGDAISSKLHMARAISRRAETAIVSLSEKESINKTCQVYINRLSDLLFVVARVVNKRKHLNDIFWRR
ncbi:MAG: cob(I)yrinic acid a,c-diamide adenosyltransferase [Nitrosopumilaceae archaeon]